MFDEKIQELLKEIEEARSSKLKGYELYDKIRWRLKFSKVIATSFTSASAIATGLTNLSWVAALTAIAGILNALIEVISKEYKAEEKRLHYTYYQLKLLHLLQDIKAESNINSETLKKYWEEYQQLEIAEIEARQRI
jgi:hypothetical protein